MLIVVMLIKKKGVVDRSLWVFMGIHSKRKESKLLLQMGVIMLTQACPNMGRIPGTCPLVVWWVQWCSKQPRLGHLKQLWRALATTFVSVLFSTNGRISDVTFINDVFIVDIEHVFTHPVKVSTIKWLTTDCRESSLIGETEKKTNLSSQKIDLTGWN